MLFVSLPALTATPTGKSTNALRLKSEPLELEELDKLEEELEELETVDTLELLTGGVVLLAPPPEEPPPQAVSTIKQIMETGCFMLNIRYSGHYFWRTMI